MAEDHETIDDVPVAVLVNSNSVSMAEMTALTAKQMPNARLIGKRTFGGLCALAGNETSSLNYSGHVGIRNETPVYVYLPTLCIFDIDKKPLDGTGVTPDIEVDFDMTKMGTTGRDSQLDRALEYIRNGN
jgi:C-terminal processing protease CtpA/Prc